MEEKIDDHILLTNSFDKIVPGEVYLVLNRIIQGESIKELIRIPCKCGKSNECIVCKALMSTGHFWVGGEYERR